METFTGCQAPASSISKLSNYRRIILAAGSWLCLYPAAHAQEGCNTVSSFSLPNAAYSVNSIGFAAAIASAASYFGQDSADCPLTDFTIQVAGGTYDFSADTVAAGHNGLIEFDHVNPPVVTTPSGQTQLHLVLQGVGSGAQRTGSGGLGSDFLAGQAWVDSDDQTTLVTNKSLRMFYGQASSHIVINAMTLMHNYLSSSQGIISFPNGSEPPGQLTLDIQPGYAPPTIEYVDCNGRVTFKPKTPGCTYPAGSSNAPTPDNFVDGAHNESGRLLRVYDNSNPLSPALNQSIMNQQIAWGTPDQANHGWRPSTQPDAKGFPNRWTIYLSHSVVPPAVYAQGAMVCIKSKESGYLGAMFVGPGSDILMNDVRWIGSGASAFLGRTATHAGMTQIVVSNSETVRPNPTNGQAPCLSSSYGGLQTGGPLPSGATSGNVVTNYFAEGTGDDSVAFFDDNPAPGQAVSYIANSTINDSFARTIFSLRSKVSNASEAGLNIQASSCNAALLDEGHVGCPVFSKR